VKAWKLILATLVIFAAGAVTGAFIARSVQPPRPARLVDKADPLLYPHHVQDRFLDRMEKELALTTDQRVKIAGLFAESRERMKIWFDVIGPELRNELRHVQEQVREELTPEQQEQFEKLIKRPAHRDGRRPRGGTNAPSSTNALTL
jgi:Spy/CpxP family protein refolding chaperone